MLVDETIAEGLKRASEATATDIRIGLGYTAVQLSNGNCGLAYTLHETEYESCCVMPEAGKLAGTKAAELIPWIKSPEVTASAVGLATLNAIISPSVTPIESDILDLLSIDAGDDVGMIGYFGPLVEPIKKRAHALHILERRAEPGKEILPESATPEILPRCSVVIISATAILNHTIDNLLELSRSAREIAVLGPSTPFLPAIFRSHRVTLLSGVQVTDPARILQIISEGGGTRQFGSAVRKISLRCSL